LHKTSLHVQPCNVSRGRRLSSAAAPGTTYCAAPRRYVQIIGRTARPAIRCRPRKCVMWSGQVHQLHAIVGSECNPSADVGTAARSSEQIWRAEHGGMQRPTGKVTRQDSAGPHAPLVHAAKSVSHRNGGFLRWMPAGSQRG
jgi:hypothetical protein